MGCGSLRRADQSGQVSRIPFGSRFSRLQNRSDSKRPDPVTDIAGSSTVVANMRHLGLDALAGLNCDGASNRNVTCRHGDTAIAPRRAYRHDGALARGGSGRNPASADRPGRRSAASTTKCPPPKPKLRLAAALHIRDQSMGSSRGSVESLPVRQVILREVFQIGRSERSASGDRMIPREEHGMKRGTMPIRAGETPALLDGGGMTACRFCSARDRTMVPFFNRKSKIVTPQSPIRVRKEVACLGRGARRFGLPAARRFAGEGSRARDAPSPGLASHLAVVFDASRLAGERGSRLHAV
jgi:hypothetical protein